MNEDPGVLPFGKFIPGFDFLKNLAGGQAAAGKGMASPLPGLGSWVAPTVNEEELDKRIKELKAVLFWLEQNATALKATIQALEVQKMTLATLAGMNMSMAEVAKAFTMPGASGAASFTSSRAAPSGEAAGSQPWPFNTAPSPGAVPPAAAPAPEPEPAPAPEPPEQTPPPKASSRTKAKKDASPEPPANGMADPLQWWGALTQQFQQIAANALRDASTQASAVKASGASEEAPAVRETARPPAARKKAAAKATAKTPAARKTAASKSASRKPAAKKSTPMPAAGGWPLPPPFRRK
ncbi:MAG: PhaM family polyhydroxyalkanoate granule multifunctional regulatory protein [Ottowia sp.]|uniref:PhaM family polyhydroxyalkanoate granule multifunctional regulatory protein n=1 Tax=Ottowia sp. TaxID=1898956 RepID=UPI003C791E2B